MILVVWWDPGLVVRGYAIASEQVGDFLARRLARDPNPLARSAGIDKQPNGLHPVAGLSGSLAATVA